MNERDFIYWLQGFLEMIDVKTLNETQVQIIRDHIKEVVVKVTPDRPGRFGTVPLTITEPLGPIIC